MLVVLRESSAGALRRVTSSFFVIFIILVKYLAVRIVIVPPQAWCRDSTLPITVCVFSKLAAWDGIAQ